MRGSRWWSPILGGVGLVLLLLVLTARLTLLDAGYDQRAVAGSDAFERLYTEVLPSDAAQATIRRALRPLPVDPAFVTANTRLLLPPDVLQAVVNELVAQFVRYLLGGTGHIDTAAVIRPAASHVETLSRHLLPGVVTTSPRVTTASLRTFDVAFARFVDGLRSGRLPERIPVLPLSPATADELTTTLTAGLDDADRPQLAGQVRILLASGHLTDALALVAPAYAAQDPRSFTAVAERVSAAVDTLRNPLSDVARNPAVRSIRSLHAEVPNGLWWFTAGGILLLAVSLALAVRRSRLLDDTVTTAVALELAVGSAVALVAGLGVLVALPDPLRTLASHDRLPAALASIVADIDSGLRAGVVGTYLKLLGIAALLALAVGVAPLAAHLRAIRHFLAPRPLLVGGVGVAVAGLVATALPASAPPTTCNGYARLCVVPYDTVTELAAHNAMAASDAGFVDAAQDPTIVGQLDDGVRALLLDFHYWTAPDSVTRYVNRLPTDTRQALAPFLSGIEQRPGVWLCHVACQLGATPAVPALRAIGGWLRSHRDAVVTLIIEDHTRLEDTIDTIEAAGLRRYVQPPPAEGYAWPTLGEMVDSGHRLVVFTERQDSPDGWLRNFHAIGAETRFQARSPTELLACAPGRGPATAGLFLLNHWVSTPVPSRQQAAVVNAPGRILQRARRCLDERGMKPTYIAVDFAQVSDPERAIDVLNHVAPGP